MTASKDEEKSSDIWESTTKHSNTAITTLEDKPQIAIYA